MKGHIYHIKNKVNNKKYIGSTIDYVSRVKHHKSSLKNKKHHCIALQRACNKYGLKNFEFKIIETCEDVFLTELEQSYIDKYGVYNCCRIAGKPPKNTVPIDIYDLKINFIGSFESIVSASRLLKVNVCRTGKYPYITKKLIVVKKGSNVDLVKEFIEKRKNKAPIYQYDLNYNLIKKWQDIKDASFFYSGKTLNNNILYSIRNKGTAYGFLWAFNKSVKRVDNRKKGIKILVFKDGKKIKKFNSITEASDKLGISQQTIARNLKQKTKTRYGYSFKYVES